MRSCSVSQMVSGQPVTSRSRQIVDHVTLLDVVHLALREQAADEAQAVFRRRRDAQLVA